MQIRSAARRAKRSCASGFRWFSRRFQSPAEYQSVIDALVADGRVDDACWLLDQVSGGSVRPGAGFSVYAGLSARRGAGSSCGRVASRARPENLLSGFWDGDPCAAPA